MKKFYLFLIAILTMAMPAMAQEDSYGLTGDFNGWGDDIPFTYVGDGVYTLHMDAIDGEFYLKQNASWAVTLSYDDETLEAGYIYDLEWKDASMKLAERYVDVTFTLTIGDTPTLKFEGTAEPLLEHVYGLTGDFNDWGEDVEFTKVEDGVYTLEMDELQGEIYLKQDHSWAVTLACDELLVNGSTYNLEWKDASMRLAERCVNVKFTLTLGDVPTLKFEGTPATLDKHIYGLNGAFNSWSLSAGPFFEEQEDGSWVVAVENFTSDDFVICIDKTWNCFRPVNEGLYTPVVVGETYDCAVIDVNQNFQMLGLFTGKFILNIVDDDHATLKLDGVVDMSNIQNIETVTEKVIYNLAGQRVNNMSHGIYIVNGKKEIVR